MKNTMGVFLAILNINSFLLMLGCTTPSNQDFYEFPESKSIVFNEVIESEVLGLPGDVSFYKDMILVCDQQTDWFFKVFSNNGFEYLGSVVRRGNGPTEEISIMPIIRPFGQDAILFQGTSTIKTAKILANKDSLYLEVIDEIDLPAQMYDDTDIFFLNGNLYSSFGLRSFKTNFQGYSPAIGNLFEWGEKLPLTNTQISELNDKQIPLFKVTTLKPNTNRLATVYSLLPILRIYNAESGELIIENHKLDTSDNIQILLNTSADNMKGLVNYYLRIKSTDEYIYALYSGKQVEAGSMPEFNEIHIWDWDGNPVLKLDANMSMASFDVSPDNKYIVAISSIETEKIFRAEIPWEQ